MTRYLITLALCGALLLAGCGGGNGGAGGTSGGASGNAGGGDVDTSSIAYQGGFQLCTDTTVAELSVDYAVDPTPDKVSNAIAEAAAGGNSDKERAEAKQGCLDALKAGDGGGETGDG